MINLILHILKIVLLLIIIDLSYLNRAAFRGDMSEEMMFNFNLLIFNDLSIDCPTPLPAPVTITLIFFI